MGGDVVDTGVLGDYTIDVQRVGCGENPAVEVTRTVHVVRYGVRR